MNRYEETLFARFGQRYLDYRLAYKDKESKRSFEFPLEIDIDVVDSCNMSCPGCHSIGRTRSHTAMSNDLLQRIAEECELYGMPAVNIGGCAEPLLNKELTIKAVKSFRDAGVMDIFLHTNGLLLSVDIAEKLIESGLTYLCVSLDSNTTETYKKMRKNNGFNMILRMLKTS